MEASDRNLILEQINIYNGTVTLSYCVQRKILLFVPRHFAKSGGLQTCQTFSLNLVCFNYAYGKATTARRPLRKLRLAGYNTFPNGVGLWVGFKMCAFGIGIRRSNIRFTGLKKI